MFDRTSEGSVLLVDMKKDRIRIRKATLHQIGDPSYIQLLVNPKTLAVAIRAVDIEISGDQTYRIGRRLKDSSNYIEIRSRPFIQRLRLIATGLDFGRSYHIFGHIIPNERAAVYYLKTMRPTTEDGGMVDG